MGSGDLAGYSHLRVRSNCAVTRSGISTSGRTNVHLKYTWGKDTDNDEADNDDNLVVQWKLSAAPDVPASWTTLATHNLVEDGVDTLPTANPADHSLGAPAENTSIDIRYIGATSEDDDQALVDDVLVTGEGGNQPPKPDYQTLLSDCVTGNNQFWTSTNPTFAWYVNQAVGSDGSSGSIKCDSYPNDQYERPTDQSYSSRTITEKPTGPGAGYAPPPPSPADPVFLSGMAPDGEFGVGQSVFSNGGQYYEYIDITRGRAGSVDVNANTGWLFFQIELFGDSTVKSDLDRAQEFAASTYYTVRLGNNASANDARSGIALRNQRVNNITTNFSTTDAKVFSDVNTANDGTGGGGVSSNGGVNTSRPPDLAGDGYDVDRGNNDWLYVRRNDVIYTGTHTVTRPTIEFAFNYKKFNADTTTGPDNFTPANITYVELDATKGLQNNQNYLWNDEYTLLRPARRTRRSRHRSRQMRSRMAPGFRTSPSSTRCDWGD